MKNSPRPTGDYDRILRWLGARTGLSFRKRQLEGAVTGIRRVMKAAGIADPTAFARLLEFDMDVVDELIVELTVGETYFFREPAHFDCLRQEILPDIRNRRGTNHVIRIWSAACASGEEPYSLAMMCDQEGLARQASILATDISPEALSKARDATYTQWSLRGQGAATAKEYLVFDADRYRLDERIARRVQFEFLNLALDVYPSHATGTMGMDVILCRNVLIYFAKETIRHVARRLYDSLADGGWLITSSGDPPVDQYGPFETVVSDYGVFYRKPTGDIAEGSSAQSDLRQHDLEKREFAAERGDFSGEFADISSIPNVPPASPTREGQRPSSAFDPQAALDRGDYRQASEITSSQLSDPAACIIHVKALANFDAPRALRKCAELAERHSLSPELHYLHAVLLSEVNLDLDAMQALQRVLFLDRSLAIAHFTMGTILQRRGALDGARKSFRNARNLCESRPSSELVLLSDQTAGCITGYAEHWLRVIERVAGGDA